MQEAKVKEGRKGANERTQKGHDVASRHPPSAIKIRSKLSSSAFHPRSLPSSSSTGAGAGIQLDASQCIMLPPCHVDSDSGLEER